MNREIKKGLDKLKKMCYNTYTLKQYKINEIQKGVKIMIKYIIVPERRMVKAMLENTTYDACNKIDKMLRDTPFCAYSDKYLMPNRFVA